MSDKRKIVIIGAGHVGSHCAMALCWRRVCEEVVLVDCIPDKAAAQAMDIADALSLPPLGVQVRSGDYADCQDADLIVISIGQTRLPGQTRLDLLADSVKMLHELIQNLRPFAIQVPVVTITNPADIVADYVRRGLGLPRTQVFGTGTLLDTARLIRVLSEASGVSRQSISAFCLGEHGDSSMIPFSVVRIGGLSLDAYPNIAQDYLLERTHMIGMDIINGKGSTEFGIGQMFAMLAEALLCDHKTIFPLSVLLQGEYGQRDVHAGVPCLVGKKGIERIIALPLNEEEQRQFAASCAVIRQHSAMAQEIAPI